MAFGCIFVPNFMVQAVVRSEAELRDRAVALVDGTAPVWSVVGMNKAAARAGIALGMTKSQAQQFCDIEIRHRSRAQEKATHAALMDLGWSVSPRVEDTAPDTIVVDLAGLNSLFGPDEKIARQLAERALRLRLSTQIAAAAKIDAAILAARGCAGITVIPEGEESKILGSLPVGVLCPSEEMLETLELWGVRTCAALAALPVLQLSERLGQEGVRLQEGARAQSEHAMVVAQPEAHFEEEMELEDAVEELEPLSFLLGRLLDQLCARLAARSMAACAIRVRFELDPGFEDFGDRTLGVETPDEKPAYMSDPFEAQRKPRVRPPKNQIPPENRAFSSEPSNDNARSSARPKIYERVLSLPVAMRDSKMLLKLVRLHLQSDAPQAPILKIFLAADVARPRVAQGGLFLRSSPDPEKLELTVARLAKLVGDANVGSPELVDTHRPGEFRMRRFVAMQDGAEMRGRVQRKARVAQKLEEDVNPPSGTLEASSDGSRHSAALRAELPGRTGRKKTQSTKTGFRVFRPAFRAKVELRNGCPSRVGFAGLRGYVVAASGPWRSSGDWWREDGWHNDEWDLEIEFGSAPETRLSSGQQKRVSSTREARNFPACETGVSNAFGSRVDAVADSRPTERNENRSATNPITKTSSQRGFYRIFYDAIRQAWFVRGMYD